MLMVKERAQGLVFFLDGLGGPRLSTTRRE